MISISFFSVFILGEMAIHHNFKLVIYCKHKFVFLQVPNRVFVKKSCFEVTLEKQLHYEFYN